MKIKINRGKLQPTIRELKINVGSIFSEMPASELTCEDCKHLRISMEPEGREAICVGTPTECWLVDGVVGEIEGFIQDNEYLLRHIDMEDK